MMTIEEIKRALVEAKQFCLTHFSKADTCCGCPFQIVRGNSWFGCRLKSPDAWEIDDWEDDSNDTTTACADVQP